MRMGVPVKPARTVPLAADSKPPGHQIRIKNEKNERLVCFQLKTSLKLTKLIEHDMKIRK